MKEKYVSTRGGEANVSASEGIIKGIAKDGGLFVPSFIHDIKIDLTALKDATYGELAFEIFKYFLDDFSDEQIKDCIHNAYYTGKFENEEPVSLKKVDDRYFLELYHGPTCAFKDMALTILPYLMTTAMKNADISKDIVILTATSGDTGKAALEGFAKVPHINIVVYYPKDGVSTIQEKQMLTQDGDNTCVIGVAGNFDDTQNGVKEILNNSGLIEELREQGYVFSSANSINIGRLLPQIVYYFYSYMQLYKKAVIDLGEAVNFVVPTGNFGNILAGYYARAIGLPVSRLICASNKNNILTDFFHTGEYNRNRDFYKTMSPSMDILISSNLERMIYRITGNDADQCAKFMNALTTDGAYEITKEMRDQLSEFFGAYATEEETMEKIKQVYDAQNYVLDTHTAVASVAYDKYVKDSGDKTPAVIASTASPYKFTRSVMNAIDIKYDEKSDFELVDELHRISGVAVPNAIEEIRTAPILHDTVCETAQMEEEVKKILNI